MSERDELTLDIIEYLDHARRKNGWSYNDLAYFLEINSLSLRNAVSKKKFSDLMVVIFKLKGVIPPDVAMAYKEAMLLEKIDKRKSKTKELNL